MEHGAVDEGDGGWKHIAGDVFRRGRARRGAFRSRSGSLQRRRGSKVSSTCRFPEHRTLFTSFIGTGYQLLTLCFCSICLGAFGSIHPTNRSAMMSAVVLLVSSLQWVAPS